MEQLIKRLGERLGVSRLVGHAPAFILAIHQLPEVAQSNASVLISGETGTGKELVARALHYLSNRASGPFVALNCGTLPDSLLETELFGHERGAFTDARTRRVGLIAEASGGTLFLDEIDSLSPRAQVTLLRVLQDKKYRAVGGNRERPADVRIIAATNAALDLLVHAGVFRADLYYRLGVFFIQLPPLRERKEDIPALVDHFLDKHSPPDRKNLRLAPETLASLQDHDWPGNVRELENAIIRGVYYCRSTEITHAHLDIPMAAGAKAPIASRCNSDELRPFNAMKQEAISDFETAYLVRLMREYDGNVSRAARTAGKDRRDLNRMLKKHGIKADRFRTKAGGVGEDTPQGMG
ncbi:MAG: Regulatory protein AtoC [bacterium]|nr:Regulatory protein AtoC [bacterium]